jgi:hypothetical protein
MPLGQPIRQDNDVCQLSKWPFQLNGGLGRSEIGKRIDLRTFVLFPWERQIQNVELLASRSKRLPETAI